MTGPGRARVRALQRSRSLSRSRCRSVDDADQHLGPLIGRAFLVRQEARTGRVLECGLGALCEAGTPSSASEAKQSIGEAIKEVAATLGNTPAVCRASYVHPALLEAFSDGELPCTAKRRLHGLGKHESRLLRFLRAA